MVLTRKHIYYPMSPVILSGIPVPYSYYFKFLGLYLDTKLSWNYHLNRIRSKLSSSCGIMYRLRNKLTRSVARMIYLSLCLPYIQYCNTIWTSCARSKLQSILTVQKKIIRFIMRKSRLQPSSPLFKKLNLLKLNELIDLNAALFVFKTINGLIPSPISFIHENPGPYNLRRIELLRISFNQSNQSQQSISSRGARLWNGLPVEIRSCRTLNCLKRNLKKHYLSQYV